MQLGRLLPWLETLLWQQVLDVADGEQLQMLGLHVDKGKLWQFALRTSQVGRRSSWTGISRLVELDFKLGSQVSPQGSGSQGGLTSSCPNSAEGAVELVQLRLVGVQHLEVDRGFDPTSHFLVRI